MGKVFNCGTMKTNFSYKYSLVIYTSMIFYCVNGTTNTLGLESCPDPDLDRWTLVNNQHCKPPNVMHCQVDHGQNIIYSMCAIPVNCGNGTRAHLNIQRNTVVCLLCTENFYQPIGKESYKYRQPNCDRLKNRCDVSDNKVKCKEGTVTQDERCRCDNTQGYKPTYDNKDCSCFPYDSMCDCVKENCNRGEIMSNDYKCVALSTTSTPAPPNTTAVPASSVTPVLSLQSPDQGLEPGAIAGIVLVIIVLIAVLLFIGFRQRIKKSFPNIFKTTCQDEGQQSLSIINSETAENKEITKAVDHDEAANSNSNKISQQVTCHDEGQLALSPINNELVQLTAENKVSTQKMKDRLRDATSQRSDQTTNIGKQIIVNAENVNVGEKSQMTVVSAQPQMPSDSVSLTVDCDDEETEPLMNSNTTNTDIDLKQMNNKGPNLSPDRTSVKFSENGTADSSGVNV